MHDVARDTLVVGNGEGAHPRHDSRFNQLIERYGAFITPLASIVLILIAWRQEVTTPGGMYLALAAVVLSGYPIVRNSVVSTITNRKLNAEVLVSCALIASIWVGEYLAAAMVVLMMNIGELLEDATIARTGEAVRALMALESDTARVVRDGREMEIDIGEVRIGDVVLIRAGEKIPIDGRIKEGRGEINQAPITGESALIIKEPGDQVFGGTLNQLGVLKIEVTRIARETMLSKIVDLVHKAQAAKPPIERIADRFAGWFTPTMLALAFLVWLLTDEVLRAVTVLVVACPCSLVIATPTAVVAGIGNAARRGILIKGGAVLEVIGKLTTFVFDKTGTLTYGTPAVRSVKTFDGMSEQQVLSLAGTAEAHSEHPLAGAILKYCREKEVWPSEPDATEIVVGRGVVATKNNKTILVGNERLFEEKGFSLSADARTFLHDMAAQGSTGVLIGHDARIVGGIAIADAVRADVRQSIENIRKLGIKRVLMLTGDNQKAARAISEGAGLDDIVADLLPEDKLAYIKKLKGQGEVVAMVGDGINDAPALVEADVGIAMGVMGTDAALEAADIALTGDDLTKAPDAIALSRKTVSIIKQSIFMSLVINGIALILATAGEIGPVVGAIVHNIGSVVVVGNSSRLIGYRFQQTIQ